jgi:hypothetical protein
MESVLAVGATPPAVSAEALSHIARAFIYATPGRVRSSCGVQRHRQVRYAAAGEVAHAARVAVPRPCATPRWP